jgi:hypothetical protein
MVVDLTIVQRHNFQPIMSQLSSAATAASVSGLSLEAYAELYTALTKGMAGGKVQPINNLEAAWFKVKDLQQVCC